MINAIYGNGSLIVTTALPNKLYDAVLFKKTILAAKGTYLGEVIEKAKIGIAIDVFNDNIESKLDSFWDSFDEKEFLDNCYNFYSVVKCQQEKTIEHILEFSQSGEEQLK